MNMQIPISKLFIFSSLVMVPGLMAGAITNVTGLIVDASSSEPCVNAVYHIFNAADTINPVINNVTEIDGRFSEEIPNSGNYLLKAEYLGLKPLSVPFTVDGSATSLDLGEISLEPDAAMLSEVVVAVKKPVVVSDGANITYNASEDPATQTLSVLDLLRKIPMVTVDGQDNIRLKGSSDFKIYLNGRPNPMFNSEPQRVLKAMPASSVLKVEVLTEPGAKYDAEGIGGILNIVTQEQTVASAPDGFAGSIYAGFGARNCDAGASLRGKKGNFSFDSGLDYSNGRIFKRASYASEVTEYLTSENHDVMTRQTNQPNSNSYDYVGGRLGFSWEPDSRNLFTGALNFTIVSASQLATTLSTLSNRLNPEVSTSCEKLDVDFSERSLSANAAYQHTFLNKSSIVASYQYASSHQPVDVRKTSADNLDGLSNGVLTSYNMKTDDNEHTAQIDYSLPLADAKHTVEMGLKGIKRLNYSDSKTVVDGVSPENVDMKQFQDIGAVYATYAGNYSNITLKGGLRYEYTHMGVDYRTAGYDDFSSDLNDLVPDVAVSWSITPSRILRAAYNMRISRPGVSQLNPYQWSISEGEVRCGNPDLSSQKSHAASLAFTGFTRSLTFNLKAEYRFINNLISSYSYFNDGVIYDSYINAGRKQDAELSAFVNCNFSSRLQVGINGSVAYTRYKIKSMGVENSGWPVNINANLSYTMPWDVRLSAYGGWSGRNYQVQGWHDGWHYYGLGITKAFLSDRLEVTLNTMNCFEKFLDMKSLTETPEIRQRSEFKFQNWSVGLNIRWNFGNLTSRMKQTRLNISNDDKANSDSKSGASGGVL